MISDSALSILDDERACLCAFAFFGLFCLVLRYFTDHPSTSRQQTSTATDGGSSKKSASVQRLHLEDIKTLPIVKYSAFKELEIGKGCKIECPVCQTEFVENECIKLLPKCDHAFNQKCIENWLIGCGTCPVCRTDLTAESSRHCNW